MNTVQQITKWTNAILLAEAANSTITELAIDSRNIEQPDKALFIAIKTNVRDGHEYAKEAWNKGVRNFLVSKELDTTELPESNVLLVPDTVNALQSIATWHRRQFRIPVIGITGSNGKTIVKEWLGQLLGDRMQVVKSPQSYNSQIGVPLSVWQIKKGDELGLFEAGISQPGEMERLERIILPTIGIFTNIGDAHNEGFMNTRQKINEKLILFRHAKQLIYCADHAILNESVVHFAHHVRGGSNGDGLQLFTWSRKQQADLTITDVSTSHSSCTIKGTCNGKQSSITIPFVDDAAIENAIHCWCALLVLQVPEAAIQAGMAILQPVSMRLEIKHGINDCTVINDAYNSDLTSLQLALNFLGQQKQHARHTIIMSDILQPGKSDMDLYDEVANYINRRNIQRFIGIGPAISKNKASFRKHRKFRSIFFKSTEQFLQNFHLLSFDKEAVLLKGARPFTFEKIAILLEQKIHQTVLTVDLSALRHNLDVFRSMLKPGVKTMAMVKAFSYGSGSTEIANLLQYAGVDYLAVAYTDEGVALRKAGIRLPIMVMSPDTSSFDRMIAWKLEPELYNFRSLNEFLNIATTLKVKNYPVHIKLDTGMHRLGFGPGDMEQITGTLSNHGELQVASIFSHLAASEDEAQDEFTNKQAALFAAMTTQLLYKLRYRPLLHLCNSAGAARHSDLQYDMVRLGLGLYGVSSDAALQQKLRQISTLKTSISQITDVPAGDNIGYGHHTIAEKDMRIATISIGYADGYMRALGKGHAYVLINGKKAHTVGSICMDMCMVNITDIEGVREGDEALIFCEELPVSHLAEWAGTIPYEIMTSISQRVKRVYINGE